MNKQASLNYLIEDGYDYDDAVELVKEASAAGVATRVGRNLVVAAEKTKRGVSSATGSAKAAAGGARDDVAFNAWRSSQHLGDGVKAMKTPGHRLAGLKEVASNGLVQAGAAGTAAVGAGGYALGREKKAALDELIQEGNDFEDAVEMIRNVN